MTGSRGQAAGEQVGLSSGVQVCLTSEDATRPSDSK